VTTHVAGLLYGSGNTDTLTRLEKKHQQQRTYAEQYLDNFKYHRFMFWSPVVPKGALTSRLEQIDGLETVINGEYKRRVELLMEKARREKQDTGNPVFRTFQILGALRD
jgi:hypothetical protein